MVNMRTFDISPNTYCCMSKGCVRQVIQQPIRWMCFFLNMHRTGMQIAEWNGVFDNIFNCCYWWGWEESFYHVEPKLWLSYARFSIYKVKSIFAVYESKEFLKWYLILYIVCWIVMACHDDQLRSYLNCLKLTLHRLRRLSVHGVHLFFLYLLSFNIVFY